MTMTTPHFLLMIASVLVLMLSSSSTLATEINNDNNSYDDDDLSAKNFRSCDSRLTPPRGTYIAISRPCEFIFYKASSSSSAAAEDNGILSDVCFATDSSSERQVTVLSTREEYAVLWPDECTGDFIRCYNINGTSDYASVYDYSGVVSSINITLALRQVMNWTVPDGATQLSVNCTADRAATEMAIDAAVDAFVDGVDAFTDGVDAFAEGFMLFAKTIFFFTIAGICGCIYCCFFTSCLSPPPTTNRLRQTQTSYEMVDQSKRQSIPIVKGVLS